MRISSLLKYFLFFLILVTPLNMFSDDSAVSLSSEKLVRGGVVFIKIVKRGRDLPEVRWMNRKISLLYRPDKNIYEGFIAADLDQKPGIEYLDLAFRPSGVKKHIKIKITEKDYGVRRLTLPDNKVNLNKKDLARAVKEKAVMDRLWNASYPVPFWDASFIMPVDSEVIETFGKRSIINGQPRSPHTGVDLRGKRGTPVKASNSGEVIFTGDHFFTGNTVVIDHGAGIMSMYFHLDKINVNKGDKISRGDVLGNIGSTGRATGPHLHWGIRINDRRIDPLTLVEISKKLEE